jgi:hypothetical protein
MCDYSLHNVVSRPAKVGDKLVSTRFVNSNTRGFAAIDEPNVAVCLLPGTEITFEKEVGYEQYWALSRNKRIFGQVNMHKPNAHHDALEFPDGQTVLVHALVEGQHVIVLQLPAAARTTSVTIAERMSLDA